jgi:mannitol-1-phosphate/altronate dehydrogenase
MSCVSGKRVEPVDSIVTVVTPHDVERYMNTFGSQQGIDAMREDFHRWIRQLHPF